VTNSVVLAGIMMAGAVDAVRGAKAPAEELKYILEHSERCAAHASANAPTGLLFASHVSWGPLM
jgi:long-subunit acyl-CoA synthetase (AMP-forming)